MSLELINIGYSIMVSREGYSMKYVKCKEIKASDLKFGVNILDYDIIVYKKLRGAIAQLVIPAGTKIVKPHGREQKMRAEKAVVLMVIPFVSVLDTGRRFVKYASLDKKEYNGLGMGRARVIEYKMGKTVKADALDDDEFIVCVKGIHFFLTESRARNY